MLQNLVKYFNACYQSDNNSLIVSNFFGNSVENRYIFEDEEELINGMLPYYPVDDEYALTADKKAKLYEKEKEFVYCSLFIVGKTRSFNNRQAKLCSPLFVYPAEIVKSEDQYFIKIKKEERRINFSLLNRIKEDEKDGEILLEQIHKNIADFNIDDTTLFGLNDVFKTFIPELNVDELLTFPNLFPEEKIKKLLQSKYLNELEGYKIIPASGAGLIKKSINTRGILNELNEISENNNFSVPLKSVFGFVDVKKKGFEKEGKVPGILSTSQKKVLYNAPLFPASLIIGPPGTGKSYTVASLAIEQLSKGKSVLVASRTDQAVDVIAEKIEEQLGIKNVIVRGGRKNHLKDLKKYLQHVLNGVYASDASVNSKILNKELNVIERKIAKLEKTFVKRVIKERKYGNFLSENINNSGFFINLRRKLIIRKTKKNKSLAVIISQLEKNLSVKNTKTVKYIEEKHSENIEKSLKHHRESLVNLLKALKARQGTVQEEFFKSAGFENILKIFPIWLVKMSDINKVLPLKSELFDVVVIDEATQCDIASSIPIIQRAKHVVVTGDPNQLRHVSFISQAVMQNYKEKYGIENLSEDILDYRHNSILDVVNNSISKQNQVFFLDEHYRSYPSIIRFSNKKFYDGALRIMKSSPDISFNEGTKLINCKGKQSKQKYNEEEANCIIQEINNVIEIEKDLHNNVCSSIGILSPFRNQTEYISKIIEDKYDNNEISRHNIRVSTAYGFQGDERDIMFLSFVLDNTSHSTAFRYIEKDDVFNVSITRAKSMQYIYHSLDVKKLSSTSLLREFIESFNEHKTEDVKTKVHDNFVDEVTEMLNEKGIKTWKAFPVAGLKIDIIAKINDAIYGIDLIGYPGEFVDAFSLERYKMLQRAGLTTIPLTYSEWIADKNRCLNSLI